MTRDRRMIVILAGLLAAISASMTRISGALRVPENVLLIGVAIAEAALFARLYIITRRNYTGKR